MRRPSFLGPGPDTDSEGPDEAFRRDGFDAPRPPPAAPSSSVSGRLGEAALRGGEAIIAAGVAGVGQAVERFGFRNAERTAAEGGEPLEAGTQTAEAGVAEAAGGGVLEGLAAAGGAAAEGAGAAAAAAFPIAEGLGVAAGVATGGAAALAGGAAYGLYRGGRWLNGGDAASSSGGEFQDLRTLNGVQQGTPQERFSVRQPRVQQPMVSRLNSSEDDAPMASGLNLVAQTSSGSESYGPVRRPRPQRVEPSFNELRREALAREPEVTNAVNDELISSLDFKMRTSNASYVIARKDVQFFPSSLSTFTPTSSRVARIPLTTGGDFLDPDSIKIAFRFVNNDATNDFNPIMGHP
ncbi:unnamed protein product, partial [Symbiodinium pilosum]